MLTVYVLKNGVGRYNTFFFNFYTKSSYLCRFRVESVNIFVCAIHVLFLPQTISHMRKRFTEKVHFVDHGIYEYCTDQH